MTAIAKALDEIKFSIPMEILIEAFKDDMPNFRSLPISLDQQIMNKVMRPRVLVDADLVGGQTIIVSLEGLTAKFMDTYTVVFEIPAERLNFRTLMNVLSVGYLPITSTYNSMNYGMGTVNPQAMTDVLSAGQRLMDSHSNVPPISNASADIIGYNTVLIRDQLRVTNTYQLRCQVGNEENLNNINPRSWRAFSKLAILATKSFIYNRLIIRIDQAYLTGGQELGAFKSYIENLSDAEENYQTYLKEVMQKVFFMNDSSNYNRYIALQMNPSI